MKAVFVPTKGGPPSCVDVYSMFLNPHSGTRRIRATIRSDYLVVNQACGHHVMAGSLSFELVDPTSVQEALKHIVNRVKHWEELERISELESLE